MFSYLYILNRIYGIKKHIISFDCIWVNMLIHALLPILALQDHEPIHGPFQGTKINNILTQILVEVALAKLAQCIPHKSSMETQSIFQKIHVNCEFVFNMDSIGLNISIWRRPIMK